MYAREQSDYSKIIYNVIILNVFDKKLHSH